MTHQDELTRRLKDQIFLGAPFEKEILLDCLIEILVLRVKVDSLRIDRDNWKYFCEGGRLHGPG